MKESQIQKKILHYLKTKGIYAFKIVTANRKGIPDIAVCYKGKYLALEVKRPGGKTTPLQDINLRQIRDSGGKAEVVTCLEEVIDILQIIDLEERNESELHNL